MLLCLLASSTVSADSVVPEDADQVRLYTTPSEQREAGLKHRLTSWLVAGGLAELDWSYNTLNYSNHRPDRSDADSSVGIQLNATATPWHFLKGDLVLDYDTDTDRLAVDESVIALEHNAWELTYGRQYLPFGVYFSHFATGPLLEFGETRDVATTLAYDFHDRADLSVGVYQGQGKPSNDSSSNVDWTLALEAWASESVSLGVSYLSDLSDAGGDLLSDTGHRYGRRVPGLSGYLLWTGQQFEVTAEFVQAAGSFRELDSDRNHPLAWNLEFANYMHPRFDWALRLEGSRELADEPQLRYGASVSFRAGRYGSLTLDYLRSMYKHNFASDDNGDVYDHGDTFAAQLSVAF